MNVDIKGYVTPRIVSLENSLSTAIRKRARTAGWPPNIAKVLGVKITNSSISVTYPSELIEQVEDLEYGTYTTPARSVIRTFMDSQAEGIAAKITAWSIEHLIAGDVIP